MSNMKQRCDFALAVTRNARESGMTRSEFVALVKMSWDALEMAERAPLIADDMPSETENEGDK